MKASSPISHLNISKIFLTAKGKTADSEQHQNEAVRCLSEHFI